MKQLAAKLSPLDQYGSSRMNQMNRQDVLGIMFCYWVERIGRGEEKIVV